MFKSFPLKNESTAPPLPLHLYLQYLPVPSYPVTPFPSISGHIFMQQFRGGIRYVSDTILDDCDTWSNKVNFLKV